MGPCASLATLLMIRQIPDQAKAATHACTAACVIVPERESTERFKNVGAMSPAFIARSFELSACIAN